MGIVLGLLRREDGQRVVASTGGDALATCKTAEAGDLTAPQTPPAGLESSLFLVQAGHALDRCPAAVALNTLFRPSAFAS